ncbi:MAG: hypothetical protein MNPFHGCM_01212 [Gemmatimonadaceae bacterium]|nr:hypothetical protein [Gemmatimonadaceae bacterium]
MRRTIREYRNAVPKLRKLSGREWRDLLAGQFALIAAQFRVWTKATGSLTSPESGSAPVMSPSESSVVRSRELALAVSRASSFGVFRPACLVRSVALCRMMERHGLPDAVVRLGVVMRAGRFHAHAWVEYGDVILGDDPASVSDYETLPGISVLHAD